MPVAGDEAPVVLGAKYRVLGDDGGMDHDFEPDEEVVLVADAGRNRSGTRAGLFQLGRSHWQYVAFRDVELLGSPRERMQ